MPDNIRLAASGASGMYLGTVARSMEINWGSEVVLRNYNESVNAFGGNLAFVNAPLRRIEIPFIFAGTGPDQAHQFISNVQGQIVQGGGATLDVQLENASWMTRFDVLGGQIVDESDIAHRRAGVYVGTLKLETVPFGYTPTTMIAASAGAVNMWSLVTATVIGDVPAPMQISWGASAATVIGTPSWVNPPLGWWVAMREGATVPFPLATAWGNSGGTIVSASIGAPGGPINSNRMIQFGSNTPYILQNASVWNCFGQTVNGGVSFSAGTTYQFLFSIPQPSAVYGQPDRRRVFTNVVLAPSAATMTLYLAESFTGRRISQRVAVPPGHPNVVNGTNNTGRLVDFGEVTLDAYTVQQSGAGLIDLVADTSDRTIYASIASGVVNTMAFFDPLIFAPVDHAMAVVPTTFAGARAPYELQSGQANQGKNTFYLVNATVAGDTYCASGAVINRYNLDPYFRGAKPFWPPSPSGIGHSIFMQPFCVPYASGATMGSQPTAAYAPASAAMGIVALYQPRWIFVR
jgi:hypothetical protein